MGGISSKGEQDIKQFLSSDYITLSYPLLTHKNSNTKVIVHQIISQSSQQSLKIISDINLYKSIKCQSISRIIDYVPLQSSKICSEQSYHYVLQADVAKFTLKEQFIARKCIKEKFTDKELAQILKAYCVGVNLYENAFRRNFYNALDMEKIKIQDHTRQLRLVDPLLSMQQGSFILRKSVQNRYHNVGVGKNVKFQDFIKRDILVNQINSVQNVDLRKAIEILLSDQGQRRTMIFEYLNIDKQKSYRLQRFMIKMNNKKAEQQILAFPHQKNPTPTSTPRNSQSYQPHQTILTSSQSQFQSSRTHPINSIRPSQSHPLIPLNSSSSSLSSTSFDKYNNITFNKVESNLFNLSNNKGYYYEKNNGYLNGMGDRMGRGNSVKSGNVNNGLNNGNNSGNKKSRINFVQSNLYTQSNNKNNISNNNIHQIHQIHLNNLHINHNNLHINQFINNNNTFSNYSLNNKTIPNLIPTTNFQPIIQSSYNQKQQKQQQFLQKDHTTSSSTQSNYKQPNKQVEEILKRLGIGSLLYQKQQQRKQQQNLQKINMNNNEMGNKYKQMNGYDQNNNNDNKTSKCTTIKKQNVKQQIIVNEHNNRQSTPIRPTLKKPKYNSTIVQVGNESEQQLSQCNSSSYSHTKSLKPQLERQYVIQHYQTGSHYQGYKLYNKRDGYGKFYYQDGGYYEGQWKNNKMSGEGKLYYQHDKLAYEGQWKDDQFNGYGKVYNDHPGLLEDGFDFTNFDLLDDCWEYYQGKLLKDTKQGRGKIKLTNAEYFQGDFQNDRIQGFGKFFMLDGTVIEGIWKDSKLIKIISS